MMIRLLHYSQRRNPNQTLSTRLNPLMVHLLRALPLTAEAGVAEAVIIIEVAHTVITALVDHMDITDQTVPALIPGKRAECPSSLVLSADVAVGGEDEAAVVALLGGGGSLM